MLCKKVKQSSTVIQKQASSQSGQALVEFVLSIMIVISFFMFYVRMSAVFAVGNYIHYATFMSARAYMSSTSSIGQQNDNATAVLTKMVSGRWKALIQPSPGMFVGSGSYFNEEPELDAWNQGATYTFKSKLTLYPWNKQGEGIDLKLSSESWMKREQSVTECEDTKQKIIADITAARVTNIKMEWDNGC